MKWCHKRQSTDSCINPIVKRYEVRALEDFVKID